MLVADLGRQPSTQWWLATVEAALQGGVNMVQLRARETSEKLLLDFACTLRRLTRLYGARLVVNRDMELAFRSEADGVHLPEDFSSVEVVRAAFKRKAQNLSRLPPLVGRSVHSVERAVRAEAEGCDYLIVGTLFSTPSHPGKQPEGLALLRAIRAVVRIPLIGIGGITPERVPLCLQAGADGIAIISAIAEAPNPTEAAHTFRKALEGENWR